MVRKPIVNNDTHDVDESVCPVTVSISPHPDVAEIIGAFVSNTYNLIIQL